MQVYSMFMPRCKVGPNADRGAATYMQTDNIALSLSLTV